MVQQSIVAKAPASTMLFGEHAVLRQGRAVVCAIDCPLYVKLTPIPEPIITCTSSLGEVQSSIETIDLGPGFRFVEACCLLYPLPCGVHIEIDSAITTTVGLGSSAAVTVGLLATLHTWLFGSFTKEALLKDAKACITHVQVRGSGSDAAASIWGGVIAYHAFTETVEPLRHIPEISLVYSGLKTPTPTVLQYVAEQELLFPRRIQAIMTAINEVTEEAIDAIHHANWARCGQCMNCANGLMEALGVGTERLSALCWALRSSMLGAKISGSGLGDSVVCLGKTSLFVEHQLPSTIARYGVQIV